MEPTPWLSHLGVGVRVRLKIRKPPRSGTACGKDKAGRPYLDGPPPAGCERGISHGERISRWWGGGQATGAQACGLVGFGLMGEVRLCGRPRKNIKQRRRDAEALSSFHAVMAQATGCSAPLRLCFNFN